MQLIWTRMKLYSSLFVCLAACSSFGGTESGGSSSGVTSPDGGSSSGEEGGVTGVAPGDIGLTPITDRAFVVRGSFVDIPIHVVRGSMANGAVDVSVTGMPTGVTIANITVPANSNDGTLKVVTTGDAKQASVDLQISANASGAQAVTKLPIFVRGAAGALDTTFAPDALAVAVASNNSTEGTLTGLNDGSMIVAGTVSASARLVKLDAEGKIIANTNLGAGRHIAPLPDGRLLNFGKITIERFSDKLVLDASFGTGGSVVMGSLPAGSTVDDVTVFNGNVLVLSDTPTLSPVSTEVSRWNADGARDTAYAACTFACSNDRPEVGAHPLAVDGTGQARAVVTCPDEGGGTLVFGCGTNGGRNLGAIEYQAGMLMLPGAAPFPTIANDGAGGLYVAGWYSLTTLVNVSPTGAVVGNAFVTDLLGARPTLATQSDRSVLVANGIGADLLLAIRRFKPDGTEDTTFTHGEAGAGVKYPYGIVVQKDGRIVVLTSSSGQMVLLRFWG